MKSEIKTTERKRASNKYRNAVVVLAIVLGLIILSILLIIKLTSNKNTYVYDRKISEVMNEINEKLDDVSEKEDPKERNNHFKELEFHHSLTPLYYNAPSAVFKVTMETGETTVLKRIIWDDSAGFNEDSIVMRLKEDCHPNLVVPLFTKRTHRSVKTQDGKTKQQVLIWIFFEYLELDVTRGKVKIYEDEIRKIMKDVLEGVKYLHDRNLAHGDIKIPNIMGTKDNAGNVVYKLIDFGFTQEFDEKFCQIPGQNFGTYFYKPPEVMESNIYGMPGDVWCIGMTAYYLSNGYIEIYNSENENLANQYMKFTGIINMEMNTEISDDERYDFASDATEDFKDFVKSCTRLDYKKRSTIDKLLKHPFITNLIA